MMVPIHALQWYRFADTVSYRKAATEELCNMTTNKIEIEVLDGIFLNLSIKSQVKPSRVQDRILRRIVEKRQAQASHKKYGRSEDLTTMHITLTCTSKCMEDIRKKDTLHNPTNERVIGSKMRGTNTLRRKLARSKKTL